MVGDALGRRIVALSASIALVAGCSRSGGAPRDASSQRAPAGGVTDAQLASAAAPPTADTTTAPTAGTERTTSGTDGSDPGRDPHRMRRVLGWVSLSIGAEAAVVAVATSILIEHQ